MRVAPIGLFYKDLDEVEKYAALSSIPTHNSNEAIAGAVAAAVGVRCALMNVDCADIINEACARASKYDGMVAEKIQAAFLKKDDEPEKTLEEIGTSYLVKETVPCAFYCFSRYFDQPEKGIIEAVNAGGDADSIACITGALCGARHSVEAFPNRWIVELENKEPVMDNAKMIFKIVSKDKRILHDTS
jgi:ADP-ribosylglycohydrolase